MRILMTIHHRLDVSSGAAGTTQALAEAYRDAGHEVSLLSYDDLPGDLPLLVQELAFPEYVSAQLARRASGFDVIDASTGDAWLWASITRGQRGRALTVTRSHGLEHVAHEARLAEAGAGMLDLSWRYPLYYGGFKLWEAKRSLQVADLALLLNAHDRAYAISRLGVAAARAHVVPNGIAPVFIGRSPPNAVGDGPLRIAQVGAFSPRKGIRYGVPALTGVLKRHREVGASFLGTGVPGREVLKAFPSELHPRLDVVERYEIENLPALLENHHVVLFPSLSEGFGKSVLEAMACGLVPVVADTPGPTEFVVDGRNGFVVPRRDAGAVERALELLIGSVERLHLMRTRAQETAQRYSWASAADARLQLYEGARWA